MSAGLTPDQIAAELREEIISHSQRARELERKFRVWQTVAQVSMFIAAVMLALGVWVIV